MSSYNLWDQLRHGDIELALAFVRESYDRDPSASRIMQLGVAYLWTKRYHEAWKHFQNAMLVYPQTMARFYGMAGVAQWCLNDPQTAVEWWQMGIATDYADAAGGIHLPLLLYVASVLRPGTFSKHDAQRLLQAKANDPRIQNWPGPLSQFVLGTINADHLELLSGDRKSGVLPQREWLMDFYKGIVDVTAGRLKLPDFKILAREIVDTSKAEWLPERNFVRLVWNGEFFIARHEGSQG